MITEILPATYLRKIIRQESPGVGVRGVCVCVGGGGVPVHSLRQLIRAACRLFADALFSVLCHSHRSEGQGKQLVHCGHVESSVRLGQVHCHVQAELKPVSQLACPLVIRSATRQTQWQTLTLAMKQLSCSFFNRLTRPLTRNSKNNRTKFNDEPPPSFPYLSCNIL